MRLEATVPDSRGAALVELSQELGLSRSQLVDEALALFLKVIMEVRRGRRLVTVDREGTEPRCELTTPTLSALEWAQKPAKLTLPAEAFAKIAELSADPPAPSHRLKTAAKRHR
jgi:hypothetical protein